MMLNKIRINILRARILCLFNRLHGDMAQQNISRGNALAQIFFLPSNFYLVPHQTKELLYLLKYLHSICLVLCNINWSISWAHFNWNFDARIMNYWYWRWLKRIKNAQFLILAASLPTSILNYGFLSFSARRTKKPPDKGEVSRPNQIRENPCSAKWKIQNRTNMHTNFCFGYPSKYYRLVISKRQQNIICDLGIVRHRLIIVLHMRFPSLFYPWLKKELFQGKFDHCKWGRWKETARDTVHCRWLFLEKKPL